MSDLRLLSRDFLVEFIDIYRENPCLWKIKSKDYYNKAKKNSGYELLVKKLKEVDHDANKDKVIKKINSLRSCFRKELKKVNTSVESGTEEIYTPNLWYYELLLFLRHQEVPNDEDHGDDIIKEEYSSTDEAPINEESVNDDSNSLCVYTQPWPQSSTSGIPKFSSTKTIKRKERSDETEDVSVEKNQNRGKFTFYGNHIAQELEELPGDMAIYCKKMINDAIYLAQIRKLTENSRIVETVQSHSRL